MRKIFVLLVLAVIMGAAAYARCQEQNPPIAITKFDPDRLLNRLGDLKPFQAEKGVTSQGYVFPVSREEFRNSLLFLSPEKTDEVMKDFGVAMGFLFKDRNQFLTLTQWRDPESAKKFMQVRGELLRLTDEHYQSHIKSVTYKELDIAKDEKALLTRKTIEQGEQQQDITMFICARNAYFFECTLMGTYDDGEVKKLILQIWKIVEASTKKGTH
jgi:hypothetical protein